MTNEQLRQLQNALCLSGGSAIEEGCWDDLSADVQAIVLEVAGVDTPTFVVPPRCDAATWRCPEAVINLVRA